MSTYFVPGTLANATSIAHQVAHRMRSCGRYGQEASFNRDQARKDLAVLGYCTFIENGHGDVSQETYCFVLPTPAFVEYPAVGEIPARRATVTGFSLRPSKDWAVSEYFVIPES